MSQLTPDMATLKSRLKDTWSAGDYGAVARDLEASAAEFLSRIPFEPGTKLLDVACGTGQIALPAARSGAIVTGIDIAENSLDQARTRAKEEGLDIQFDLGDAENMSYEDASFDIVFTLIGAMFAPRPELIVSEFKRVCRPGGRIVMGNWTPEGFIGLMFKTVGKYVPPPPGMPSPLMWGQEEVVRERFSEGISELNLRKHMYPFPYPFPPIDVVDYYIEHFGPMIKAFAALDTEGQSALRQELIDLWTEYNTGADNTTYVDAEILEVVAVME